MVNKNTLLHCQKQPFSARRPIAGLKYELFGHIFALPLGEQFELMRLEGIIGFGDDLDPEWTHSRP